MTSNLEAINKKLTVLYAKRDKINVTIRSLEKAKADIVEKEKAMKGIEMLALLEHQEDLKKALSSGMSLEEFLTSLSSGKPEGDKVAKSKKK